MALDPFFGGGGFLGLSADCHGLGTRRMSSKKHKITMDNKEHTWSLFLRAGMLCINHKG